MVRLATATFRVSRLTNCLIKWKPLAGVSVPRLILGSTPVICHGPQRIIRRMKTTNTCIMIEGRPAQPLVLLF